MMHRLTRKYIYARNLRLHFKDTPNKKPIEPILKKSAKPNYSLKIKLKNSIRNDKNSKYTKYKIGKIFQKTDDSTKQNFELDKK